ncbi:MAG: di-trans,poly-cis-decaprenylcistransferase [Oscillospiraceae bacterium]|jgi:undecaprenyl diphosphate synthase|nr:di-trans,poly-cis-decaprenylcistransferase [Oscillospiraceae bacterium]
MSIFSGSRKKKAARGEKSQLPPPKHIAIIMDGNGRWAKRRGLPRYAGHSRGAEVFRKIATYAKDIGVEYLTVYAFSTENWKRSEEEITKIFSLLDKYLAEALTTMREDGVRIHVLGDISRLSESSRELIETARRESETIDGVLVNLCINYGGRADIINAVRQIAAQGVPPERITDETVSGFLYTGEAPDPDLIIRTGGEIRLSNFLTWQSVYSELYFCDTLWPDYTERDLDAAIAEFHARSRRFGAE